MPRKPRLFIPDQPVHVVKRGHNRGSIVVCKADYDYFVECLASACREYGVALHAWVLMTNHIHLLASPESEDSLPKMMQGLGGHYARYFNRCYRRRGSLWEGRYKTSLIDSDEYLLKCYRYIELNPVRAGMVEHPRQYPWSSYRANAQGENTAFISPHPVYLALSSNKAKRYERYRDLFQDELDRHTLTQIRRGIEKGKAVGNPAFLLKVARIK
ncbi:MAG: transposase [Gammaproteobacteria bacterium]